jgi:hypothetical protein
MPRRLVPASLLFSLLVGAAGTAGAQQSASVPEIALTGRVADASGAILREAVVRILPAEGDTAVRESKTDAAGRFTVRLPAGQYRIRVTAPAFRPFEQVIAIAPGVDPLKIVLQVAEVQESVVVRSADELIADTTMSLTSTTLSGDELLGLPTNEDDLARYLMLLAGADISGDIEDDVLANFIIDGFSDNRLPRPDQIAQIIVDPNSMSADGDGPRIEIVTRPGSGEWRRSVDFGFADESLNARTPGEARKEPRQTRDISVEVEGPIIANVLEMSFESTTRADDRAGDSLRAITPTDSLFSGVVQPQRQREVEIGAELQITPAHRLDVQFAYGTERSDNEGVGGFTLPERASAERGSDWMFRMSERTFAENRFNSMRLQVSHDRSTTTPLRQGFAIDVADAFEGGGGTNRGRDDTLSVSFENDLRWERGTWNFEWGSELEYGRQRSIDRDNYNGTFEFASLHDYCRATNDPGPNCAETRRIVSDALAGGVAPTYLDASGRGVEITGLPVTFTQAFGNADLRFSEVGFSTHLQADRRFGSDASLRLGVRYDGTNHSRDFLRFNPTANFQYRLTKTTLLSVGSQLSFQDFGDYERLLRNDGSTYETELSISSPSFPDPFQGGTVDVGAETASLWQLDPEYRSPYTVSPRVSVTQQVPGNLRVTLSYSANYGYRQRRTRNVNAPFPGTPLPPEILELSRDERQDVIDRLRPFYPHVGNITRIESSGRSASRSVRLQIRPRGSLELFGFEVSGNVSYGYTAAEDDNDFNNPYRPEWGPTRRDHSMQSTFRVRMPDENEFGSGLLRALARATYEGMNLNFSFRADNGSLYSIRSGTDLNGDQATRDRPPGVPRNSERGPAIWGLDMTFTKDYELAGRAPSGAGEDGAGAGRRRGPRLRFQARINNLLNQTQPRAYGSVLTSPLFGLPVGFTDARTVALSTNLDF